MSGFSFGEKMASARKQLLFLLYPPKCAACGATGYKGLCPECSEAVKKAFQPKKFLATGGNGFADAMYTLFIYDEYAVKKLLFGWKREDYRDLPPIFAPYIQKFLSKRLLPERIHCIAYLPRRRWKRRKAGFDQAERIASLFSQRLHLPLQPLLFRRGFSKAQRKAKFEDREKNVRGVFHASLPLAGQTVLLIDDIVTTGATAREGARILKQAGAMKVYILSLAH